MSFSVYQEYPGVHENEEIPGRHPLSVDSNRILKKSASKLQDHAAVTKQHAEIPPLTEKQPDEDGGRDLIITKASKKHGKCSFATELDTGRHIVPQTAKLCRDLYI